MKMEEKLQLYNQALLAMGFKKQLRELQVEANYLPEVVERYDGEAKSDYELLAHLADICVKAEQIGFYFGYNRFESEKDKKLEFLQHRILLGYDID